MMQALGLCDIERFRSIIAEGLGLLFEDSRLDLLANLLRERMRTTNSSGFGSYLDRLASGGTRREEMRALADELTVGETYFFRHQNQVRAFAEAVLPRRLEARARCGARGEGSESTSSEARELTILSAGCASGEEPYTLAAVVRDEVPELESWNVSILGIDVNTHALGKAARARYSSWSLREMPAQIKQRLFRQEGQEFILAPAVRDMVRFEERNLLDDDDRFWRPGAFDVVFCRNVIMYFTPEAVRSVIARLAGALTPGGYLFLGPAETLRGISHDFHLRHTHETFYYERRDRHETPAQPRFMPTARRLPLPAASAPPPAADTTWVDLISRASDRITALAGRSAIQAMAGNGIGKKDSPESPRVPSSEDLSPAKELLRGERFDEVIAFVQGLPPQSRSDPDARLLCAVALTNRGAVDAAEEVCEEILAVDDLNAGAHYLRALSREHAGDRAGAIEEDQAAMYLDPTFAMPRLHLGLLARRSGEMETARRELGQAVLLLAREESSRILLFGGGFSREALTELCRSELRACGGPS